MGEEERGVKEIYKCKLTASRPVGRPKTKWMDNVMNGIQAVRIVNWERGTQDRNEWRSIVERAKTCMEL
jgi:hypothetical protein